jgi:uncharacterized protein
MLLRTFRFPLLLTLVALVATWWWGGWAAFLTVAILAVLEISLSFENAVVNAKLLGRLNPLWQKLFLTVGIVIAVFGMRLVFPLVIVSVAGHLSMATVLDLALNHPEQYAEVLHSAHPAIAAFGGTFLLMLFLDFIIERRDVRWLRRIEDAMAKIGRLEGFAVMIALIVLLFASQVLAPGHQAEVLLAGIAGLLIFLALKALITFFEVGHARAERSKGVGTLAKTGLFTFLYLEVIDASFSFDGVVGAFAVTNKIVLIALGLGIGALFVRSLTVYLVREGTLDHYVYLEHGAHYAVGALAVLLFITIRFEVPEAVTGLFGIGFISIAFLDSLEYRKRHPKATAVEHATLHSPYKEKL